ncbi:MAG: class I SAM-dependent methyltransferase [Thermoleophilia bacterium]
MTHEFNGRKYEKASTHQKEWGAKLIAELELRGAERVLDLGCGDGALTVQITDLVPRGEVVGIDASRGMIEVAMKKQRDNLRFVLMDINELNIMDEFDVVISNAALHWITDHKRLLESIRRSLRTGGVLRFNFAGDGNCSHFFKVVREAMSLDGFSSCFAGFKWPFYMPATNEYEALVQQSGFRDARVWGENADRFFPDTEAMINWVDQPSLVPFLACIADEDKNRFRDFVVNRMVEDTKEDDGRCFETFRRINVFARK